MFCNTFQSIQHNTYLTGLKAFMLYKKLLVGNDQEKAQSEKDSHSRLPVCATKVGSDQVFLILMTLILI